MKFALLKALLSFVIFLHLFLASQAIYLTILCVIRCMLGSMNYPQSSETARLLLSAVDTYLDCVNFSHFFENCNSVLLFLRLFRICRDCGSRTVGCKQCGLSFR